MAECYKVLPNSCRYAHKLNNVVTINNPRGYLDDNYMTNTFVGPVRADGTLLVGTNGQVDNPDPTFNVGGKPPRLTYRRIACSDC